MGSDNFQPEKTMPEMPKGGGKLARRIWRREGPPLFAAGIITAVDGQAFWNYCLSTEERDIALKDCQKNGRNFRTMFEDKDGNLIPGDMKANPAFAQMQAAIKAMKAFEIEFGLTPASRSKLKIEKKGDGDKMSDFLSRKKSAEPLVVTPEDGVNRPN
jgi:P27 family predicted phage terminase small subunit